MRLFDAEMGSRVRLAETERDEAITAKENTNAELASLRLEIDRLNTRDNCLTNTIKNLNADRNDLSMYAAELENDLIFFKKECLALSELGDKMASRDFDDIQQHMGSGTYDINNMSRAELVSQVLDLRDILEAKMHREEVLARAKKDSMRDDFEDGAYSSYYGDAVEADDSDWDRFIPVDADGIPDMRSAYETWKRKVNKGDI